MDGSFVAVIFGSRCLDREYRVAQLSPEVQMRDWKTC